MTFHARLLQRAALDRFALELAGIRRRFADQDHLHGMTRSRAEVPLPPVGRSGAEWEVLLEAVAHRLRRVADTSLAVPDPDGEMPDRAGVLECAEALGALRGQLVTAMREGSGARRPGSPPRAPG
jgi:hypothetical protein